MMKIAFRRGARRRHSFTAGSALAYDGTKCGARQLLGAQARLPGQGRGLEVRPQARPEGDRQAGRSERAMEERNAKRAENFKKTGKWEYDVTKI